MAVHGNLINGEWVTGADVNRDVNPSNLQDVVGEYARADAAQAHAAIAAARAAFPAWSRATRRSGPTCSTARGTRSCAARRSSAPCSPARRGRRSPRGSARPSAPATSSSSSPARSCGRTGSCSTPCGPASRWRSRASRSASWASSRPGTSRSRFPPGRSRPRSPTGTASSSSPPTWCRAAPGPSPTSSGAPACRPGCSTWSWGGDRRRRGAHRVHRRRRGQLHGLRGDGPRHREEGRRAHGQDPARDGGQEPAGRPRRRRPGAP